MKTIDGHQSDGITCELTLGDIYTGPLRKFDFQPLEMDLQTISREAVTQEREAKSFEGDVVQVKREAEKQARIEIERTRELERRLIDKHRGPLTGLRRRLDALQKEEREAYDRWEEGIRSKRRQAELAQDALSKHDAKVSDLQSQINEWHRELERLRYERDSFVDQESSCHKEIESFVARETELRKRKESLCNEIFSMERQRPEGKNWDSIIDQLRGRRDSIERDVVEEQRGIDTFKGEILKKEEQLQVGSIQSSYHDLMRL